MCGIIAYTGARKALPILIDGLQSLEYRGYDSAGLYICGNDNALKSLGRVANLKKQANDAVEGSTGIAHTRWATHGVPSEANAHPHMDTDNQVFVVHNGIIENYQDIKDELKEKGIIFRSETDSEVLAHLISEELKSETLLEKAVTKALTHVRGAYGIAVVTKKEPTKLVVARMGSPLLIGLGEGEYFVASDGAAIIRHTRKVIYLNDKEIAVLTPHTHDIYTLDGACVDHKTSELEFSFEAAEKNGFDHFMLKEIMEGPEVIKNTLRGRILPDHHDVVLGGLKTIEDKLRDIKRLVIVGCGSAYYAGQVGEYMLEQYARIPVEVCFGSEFRYKTHVFEEGTALLAISQSGETADTLEAIREAKRQGILTLGIVNVVGSSIARETDAGIYNHAGPEVAVATTKAFISQLTTLALFTTFMARRRGLDEADVKKILNGLSTLPEHIKHILKNADSIKSVAAKYAHSEHMLYIGRKYQYPIAYEGALKMKEISYLHAEAYAAGELKHGPIALIEPAVPTVALCTKDNLYEKMISNIQEIKARRGPIVAVATEGDESIKSLADAIISVPETHEMLYPILSIIPLQLFAYYAACIRGLDVDKPRNLAKSVTVE